LENARMYRQSSLNSKGKMVDYIHYLLQLSYNFIIAK